MTIKTFTLALLCLGGCTAARWEVVPVQHVNGWQDGGSYLIDKQTGQTWIQAYASLPTGQEHVTISVPYWRKMSDRPATTLPAEGPND